MQTTKLGPHVQHIGGPVSSWLAIAKPMVATWLEFDVGLLEDVKRRGGVNIARVDYDINAFDVNGLLGRINPVRQQFGSLIDYFLAWNEPPCQGADMDTLAAVTIVLVEEVKSPMLVGCIAEGNPANLDDWHRFYAALEVAQSHGGGLALHEYDAPTLNSSAGWTTLRYRKMLQLFPANLRNIPIYLTEVGIDGGVLNPPLTATGWEHFTDEPGYLSQFAWYDSELQKDPQIKGATIFDLGAFPPFNQSGKTFDIANCLKIAKYIGDRSMQPTAPPPPTYNVGPGVAAKLKEHGDTATSDEQYLGSEMSFTVGTKGIYVFSKGAGKTTFIPAM